MEIQKVSFVGCGALGIMYASHMRKTLPYSQVQFIAGQDRIDRYRNAEFYANDVRQSFQFVSPDEPGQPSDLMIFTVKSYGLDAAAALVKKHIGENTVILSFLNGISSEEVIGKTYNPAKIIHSIVAGMDPLKTGTAINFKHMGYIAFGGLPCNEPEDIDRLARFFDRVQIKYEIRKDIIKEIWWKFMLNIGINQTTALLRSTYGLFQNSVHAENIMLMAMREAYEVSQKLHIGLEERDFDSVIATIKALSPDGKTSMYQDIEAKRPTEIDIFAGKLIALAMEYDVPVPINTFLYNAIKALESRN